MTYDFDTIIPRRGTGSVKWDEAAGDDILPMWVADMDFATAPAIVQALAERVRHGVFGYVHVPDAYYDALTSWFALRHNWTISRNSVIYVPGVVPAISAIIKALTRPGDGVIVQTPAYNCFFSSVRNNGCRLMENKLTRVDTDGGFTYAIDFDDLEAKAADPRTPLMILCNPHNPTGRVWTRAELERVAEICRRHGVTVVSDEIHCELTMPGIDYVPYATVDSDAVVCCSPSKAFNIAGLQIANIIVEDSAKRYHINRAVNDNEVCDVNPMGVAALIAAYNEGGEWLDQLREYLHENYRTLRKFFNDNFPNLPVADLSATYLAWIDITALGMTSGEVENMLLERGKVWVNGGAMYGDDRYIRINMACPRTVLLEGLRRIFMAL
jgi:cystathionine beta-lyase